MAFMVHDNEVMDGGFSYTSLEAAETDLENDLLPDGTNIYIKGVDDDKGLFYKVVDGELIPFGGGSGIDAMTQAEYDALTPAEKSDGSFRGISDGNGYTQSATATGFSPRTSGLQSLNANDAIIEVNSKVNNTISGNTVELTNTATSAHAVGEYFILGGQFVKCTTAIAVGDTITIGTNVEATNVASILSELNGNLINYTPTFSNLVNVSNTPPRNTIIVNGILFLNEIFYFSNTNSNISFTINLPTGYEIGIKENNISIFVTLYNGWGVDNSSSTNLIIDKNGDCTIYAQNEMPYAKVDAIVPLKYVGTNN